jgi:hypothetical protein
MTTWAGGEALSRNPEKGKPNAMSESYEIKGYFAKEDAPSP